VSRSRPSFLASPRKFPCVARSTDTQAPGPVSTRRPLAAYSTGVPGDAAGLRGTVSTTGC